MTSVVDVVNKKVASGCIVSGKLNKRGCKVSLRNIPKVRLIVDFDKPNAPLGPSQTRCDYLLIAEVEGEVGWVVPLELKGGRLDADEVAWQLQAGASAAELLVPPKEQVKCMPVVAYGNISKYERNRMKNKCNKIRFRSSLIEVRLMKCGTGLTGVLGS